MLLHRHPHLITLIGDKENSMEFSQFRDNWFQVRNSWFTRNYLKTPHYGEFSLTLSQLTRLDHKPRLPCQGRQMSEAHRWG